MTKLTREDVIEKHKKAELLDGLDLSRLNLSYLDLTVSAAYLYETDLSFSNLSNANLNLIIRKDILTFQAYDKHFAYFCNGILKIGCKSLKPIDWLNHYEALSKEHNYDEKTMKAYLNFINHCKELTNE